MRAQCQDRRLPGHVNIQRLQDDDLGTGKPRIAEASLLLAETRVFTDFIGYGVLS